MRFPISKPSLGVLERDMLMKAFDSGWISSLGDEINRFELEYASFCKSRFALTVSNGTTALHLALETLGIGPGDEVIVPDLTFVATANAVMHSGATPVFVDIEENSLGIDAEKVVPLITEKTKAIIAVHLYGHPCRMNDLLELARKYHLFVVEDAAEAHGARFQSRMVGSLGHIGVFSFYGNKLITTGEGGMLTTDSEELYQLAKNLRDHSMSAERRYWHTRVGFNYRMTNLQAAIGRAQLTRFPEIEGQRRRILNRYRANLEYHPGIKLNRSRPDCQPVNWLVCVEVDGLTDVARFGLMKRLGEKGIDSRPFFYPISDFPMYERANTPVAHRISQCGLNLPTYADLTDDDIDWICKVFVEEFKHV